MWKWSRVHIRAFKPFVTEDITGKPVLIESKKQLRKLCEEHGCYSKYVEDSYNRDF